MWHRYESETVILVSKCTTKREYDHFGHTGSLIQNGDLRDSMKKKNIFRTMKGTVTVFHGLVLF
jgi:hypothetical protein